MNGGIYTTKYPGYTKRFSLSEYEISNDGKKKIYNPYTILAEKDTFSVEDKTNVTLIINFLVPFREVGGVDPKGQYCFYQTLLSVAVLNFEP